MLELSIETESPVKLMSLSPEGNYLATVDERNYCHIYKLEYETQLVAKQIQARDDLSKEVTQLFLSLFEILSIYILQIMLIFYFEL